MTGKEEKQFGGLEIIGVEVKEVIGKGGYRTSRVFQVLYEGSPAYVGKEFRFTAYGSDEREKELVKKYQRWANLQHPNIVRFIGVFKRSSSISSTKVPLLVTEKMNRSLNSLLNHRPKYSIAVETKLSILLDVSLGIEYLHHQTPPLVHSNLSSYTILLNTEQRAKISDIEGDQIAPAVEKSQTTSSLSTVIREDVPTQSNDVFSYGTIALQTITQWLPVSGSLKEYQQRHGLRSGKSIVEQYQSYLDRVTDDTRHLKGLILSCLHDDAKKRPTISEISRKIKTVAEGKSVFPIIPYSEVNGEKKKYTNETLPPADEKPTEVKPTTKGKLPPADEKSTEVKPTTKGKLPPADEQPTEVKPTAEGKLPPADEKPTEVKPTGKGKLPPAAEQPTEVKPTRKGKLPPADEQLNEVKPTAKGKRSPADEQTTEVKPTAKGKQPLADEQPTDDKPTAKGKLPPADEQPTEVKPTAKGKRPQADEQPTEIKPTAKGKLPPADEQPTEVKPTAKGKRPLADEQPTDDKPTAKGKPPPADEPLVGFHRSLPYAFSSDGLGPKVIPTERAGGVGHAGSFTEINDSWEIPQNKLECFQLEFNALDGQKNGYLTVEKASVFLKSLELDDIKIWALCDQDGDGFVSVDEYCAARWIALRAMNNVTIPDKMPSDLQPSISNRNNKHNVPRFENKQKDGFAEMQAELEKARNELKEKTADIEKKNKIIETMKKQLGCLPIAARCTVENLMDHVIVNQKVSVIVMLKNSLGQAVPGRKESIAVILSSAKQIIALPPHSIEDQRSGHYRISFFLNHVGYHELNILVCEISIPGMPHRIRCLSSSSPALDPAYGPKVKPLQNLKFNCYFNSILQAINQTQGVAHLNDKYKDGVIRPYVLSFVDSDSSKTPKIVIELTGNPGLVLQEMNAILDEFDLEKSPSFVIQAENLLNTLAASSNQQRFVSYAQEDSHELLRHFLYELKKEEVNCIKASIFNKFGVTADPLSHVHLQNEYKIAMKYYLRVASKVTTPIDEIFGGVKLNTVICRECRSPSQTLEPFFDISLGVINDMQHKIFSKANCWQQQQQHQHQSRQTRSNTASGGGSSKHPPMWDPKKVHKINYDAKSAQDLLVKKKMPYLPTRDNHESDIATDLERSLTDHTAIDNMDEDNKFICQECTNRKGGGSGSGGGGGGGDDVVLCLVAKQIIIHKLPKVLILHIKRFNIGDYMVKKDSTHITFPPILNMAPYCSNTCLEECGDANNNIFYGLYAVVEHNGVTLKSGHYVAYVRRRPPRDPQQYDYRGKYDQGVAYDGKWLYTSDEVIRESQWDDVKNCDAYLLFYELLPRKKISSMW